VRNHFLLFVYVLAQQHEQVEDRVFRSGQRRGGIRHDFDDEVVTK
jgi:hypothetical protein